MARMSFQLCGMGKSRLSQASSQNLHAGSARPWLPPTHVATGPELVDPGVRSSTHILA